MNKEKFKNFIITTGAIAAAIYFFATFILDDLPARILSLIITIILVFERKREFTNKVWKFIKEKSGAFFRKRLNKIIILLTAIILVIIFLLIFVLDFDRENNKEFARDNLIIETIEYLNENILVDTLLACSDSNFISNGIELNSYLNARSKVVITNGSRVAQISKKYFENVLYFQKNKINRIMVKLFGEPHLIQFGGFDSSGIKRTFGTEEISENLIKQVCSDLNNINDLSSFQELLEYHTSAIATNNLKNHHKIGILNVENTVLRQKFGYIIRSISEESAKKILFVRKNFIKNIIETSFEALNDKVYTYDAPEVFYKLHAIYIKDIIDLIISKNNYSDILQFLLNEIQTTDDKEILKNLWFRLVRNNNLFLLKEKGELIDILKRYKEVLEPEFYKDCISSINFNPSSLDNRFSPMSLHPIGYKNSNFKDLYTVVSFTIPYKFMDSGFVSIDYSDSIEVGFLPVTNLFDDAVFRFLNELDHSSNGMPLTIYSDAIGGINKFTQVYIRYNYFYHPEQEILNDTLININFSDKSASIGRRHYPLKEEAILILRKIFRDDSLSFPVALNLDDLTIELFSNYSVDYSTYSEETINFYIRTTTNLEGQLKVKNRYLTLMNELNFGGQFKSIKDVVEKSIINSSSKLQEYIYQLCGLAVKENIEFGESNKLVWEEGRPLPFEKVKLLVSSYLKPTLEVKGIYLVDDLFSEAGSYNLCYQNSYNDRSFKTVVSIIQLNNSFNFEKFKEASEDYLNYQKTEDNVILFFWYKNENFDEPEDFKVLDEFNEFIQDEYSEKNTKIILVDCTKNIHK